MAVVNVPNLAPPPAAAVVFDAAESLHTSAILFATILALSYPSSISPKLELDEELEEELAPPLPPLP